MRAKQDSIPRPTSCSLVLSLCGRNFREEGRKRRGTVELVGVTGGKCMECRLLIGTRTRIYNQ